MVRRSLSVYPLEGRRGVAEPISRAAESAYGGEERQAAPEDHGDDEGEEELGPGHGVSFDAIVATGAPNGQDPGPVAAPPAPQRSGGAHLHGEVVDLRHGHPHGGCC